MKAITILERCRDAEGDMRRIRQQIQQRREASECITLGTDSPTGRVRASAVSDRVLSVVAAIDDLERDLAARDQAYRVEVTAACAMLEALPAVESAVLHKVYIKRMSSYAIAKRMGYSQSYIRSLKARGDGMIRDITEEGVSAVLPAWYAERWPEREKRPRGRF